MTKSGWAVTSSTERDEWGCIVTLREQKTRQTMTLHEPGLRSDALRRICERADALDGDWRIISYSTPETILSDLHGRTKRQESDRVGRHIVCPESRILGTIRRKDLLADELRYTRTA